MKNNILFFADSSLLNPILHSQGLPLLNSLNNNGFGKIFLTFENSTAFSDKFTEIQQIKKRYCNNIVYEHIFVNSSAVFSPSYSMIYGGIKKVLKLTKEHKIDIVHCRSFFPTLIAFIIKKIFRKKIKIIYDPRGLYVDEMIFLNGRLTNPQKIKILRKIENYFYSRSDKIVLVSNRFKSYVIDKHKYAVENRLNHIVVIPNKTKIENIAVIESFNSRRKSNLISCIYVGSTAPWQMIEEIKHLYNETTKVWENIKFCIATYSKESIRKYFPDEEKFLEKFMIEDYDSSNVFQQLIKYHFGVLIRAEGVFSEVSSPLKFAEYLAAGLPVLINEGVGDTEEIIKKYKVGVVIRNYNYKDALLEMKNLLNEDDIFDRCRQVALQEFDLRDSIKEYHKLYESLCIH